MPYSIHKQGEKWCVVKDADGESMGCHDSEEGAKRQMMAIHAHEDKALRERVEKRTEYYQQINALYKAIDGLDAEAPPVVTIPDVQLEGLDLPPAEPHTHTEPKTLYAAPTSNDTNIVKALIAKFQHGMKPGQSILKAADGKRLMLIVTSNSYQDREAETLTSTALKEDVDRHWTQGDDTFMSNNKLLFWHDDALELGDIIWGDMIGPFYVEIAKEADTPLARRYFDYREAHPDEKWGASHRFAYYSQHRNEGGDYTRIYKQETTSLPLEAAANLITLSEVIPMSDKRAKKFNEIMGFEGAYELLKTEGFDALRKKLAEQGIEHKSVDTPEGVQVNPDAFSIMAKSFVQTVEDMGELDKTVADAVKVLNDATKAFNDKTAQLDAALKDVQEKQTALDTQLKQRPSSASRADETIISDKKLEQSVAESLLPKHPTFGVPYKAGE